jgi:hypothetical protein
MALIEMIAERNIAEDGMKCRGRGVEIWLHDDIEFTGG